MKILVIFQFAVILIMGVFLSKHWIPNQEMKINKDPSGKVTESGLTNLASRAESLKRKLNQKPSDSIKWNQVESDDYLTYIDNLRRIGCPEKTINDIVSADIMALYEYKRNQLAAPLFEKAKTNGRWIPVEDFNSFIDKAWELANERNEVHRQILGKDPPVVPSLEFLEPFTHLHAVRPNKDKIYILPEPGEASSREFYPFLN